MHDVVIARGRVVDPESGLDDVRDVGIIGDQIVSVSTSELEGRRRIDAHGLVVVPGFVDLHSHAQAVGEMRLQALDGVTTALELEAGVSPVDAAYRRAGTEGRPINFGYSTSWAAIRRHVVGGEPLTGGLDAFQEGLGADAWRAGASPAQQAEMMDMLHREIADGALGIGVLLGYAPRTDPAEYLSVARLASSWGVPVFTHARPLVEQDPDVVVDGASEIARTAAETGAHMHFCHINSTSSRHLDRVQGVVTAARDEGSRITSEAYPYGSGMTGIGSEYFHPDRLHVLGGTGTTQDVIYAATGETVASRERLLELRALDPSALAFIKGFDEEQSPDRLEQILTLPGAAVASDAVPFVVEAGYTYDPLQWPLPAHVRTHPRSAGTFARTLRIAVKELGALTLSEAVARCSLYPADIAGEASPAMKQKGRIQVGCDADISVFDLARVTDAATYQDSTRPSQGFTHVMVNGELVVNEGLLLTDALPGRPVRGQS
ncbi:D-glutamate deacylase [Aeromicrobium endophyticum]|uniref:D-glutamate deacylase n=2 Tax=Aeromicrobium endophyticum TaxID=2292704 RepID=A0A371NZX7_9ACTN|nr:D-glutamate deacylase [Aeromicrobium endophyticum]